MTKANGEREFAVATMIEARWECEVHGYGDLSPFDWAIVKDGKVKALAEFKSRDNDSLKYKTIFVSLRKYIDIMRGAVAMKCKAFYIVEYHDQVKFLELSNEGKTEG